MTLEYRGIKAEYYCKGNSLESRYVSTRKERGREVRYFDVICKDEVKVNVPFNRKAIREMSTWNFLCEV